MMNYPPLNELVEKAGCRYMLVTAVAKRARQLLDDTETLGERKPVSVAVEEFFNGKYAVEKAEE